ncbi:TPA: hypothetical protein N0F65_006880 [Lagenidium giganteum]|uniref:Uncharacterized protein n=1 Tax=Lagenidium giganteum TaxID=4803 RepID=A0AAV2ZK49_9STRA|nr:TPA: hypothetical protein N0F65_006880 [Lagenidium giganteum]
MNKKLHFDNRLCYERDVTRQHALHQQKLKTVLPTCKSPSKVYLDSNQPLRYPHLRHNLKRQQLERERQLEIYSQNQRLANKMEQILHRQENVIVPQNLVIPNGPTSPRMETVKRAAHPPAYVHMPGIRIDATQTPIVDCYLSPENSMGRGNACKKTTLINKGVQKRRQDQIEQENRRLKQRLQQQKPFYNAKKWVAEWQESAQKFQHLHQNGTVGYLPPPKTSHGRLTHAGADKMRLNASLPSRSHRNLPAIGKGGPHGNANGSSRAARLQRNVQTMKVYQEENKDEISSTAATEGLDDDDDLELVPETRVLLLEAQTKKGVVIQVEEVQVEVRRRGNLSQGSVQYGDQGLIVTGMWENRLHDEYHAPLLMISSLAQRL